jgi:hypothetical protein
MKKKSMSRSWFIVGMLSAATFGAFANLPSTGSTSGSMAPTQDVSEIRTLRHADLSFDQDLKHLTAVQGRYHENLPPMKHKASARPMVRRTVKKTSAKTLAAPRVRAKVGQR